MNGGFQIRDYQELYDEYQKSNYGAAETLQMATMDFINSYKEGSPRALDAYDGLNLLHVPEAGDMPFGDYVVKGKTDIDFYARVLSQAGTGTVNAILSLLSAGLAPYTIQSIIVDDDEEEEALTWAEKMADSALWDIIDSDDLSQDEKDEYSRQYGDDAKAIFKQMQDFATNYENSLAFYDENKAQKEMAGSNLEETVDKMDEMDESDTCDIYVEAYKLLNKYMANSDMPLGEWIVEMGKMTSDEVDYTQLFPMIDSMSYAQARMTELTGFIPTASNLGENVRSKEYQELLDQTRNKLQNLIGDNSISIWSNSDPEIASKKVAFTSFAIRQNAASSLLNDQLDDTWTEVKDIINNVIKYVGLAASGLTVLSFVAGKYFIGGLVMLIAKWAAAATLLSAASTVVYYAAIVFKYAGYAGLAILGVTILFTIFCAVYEWAMKNAASDYTTMPDYVIDAVKNGKSYSSVKYKGVRRGATEMGDLNGKEGYRGWVCMYTSTDTRVGSPICADSSGNIFNIKFGDSSRPDDCDCVNFFGQITPGNCNTNMEKDNVGGIYIYYHTEKSLKNRSSSITYNPDPRQKPEISLPETKQYYHDIIVRSGTTEAIAKAKITSEGYYIWDQNLCPGARTVWETDGQYSYIGYKVTDDPDDAITDIRVATFTPGGEVYFGDIKYGCAGTLGFPASSRDENNDYPQNLDGLFVTRSEKAGTAIEVGKLHLVSSYSDAQEGWEPVTTFSGLPYNFCTTRYNSQGLGKYKPGRYHVYPFEYTGYVASDDNEWVNNDRYMYYEPETKYTSENGTKYLSGMFFAFGTDSEEEVFLGQEVAAKFSQLTSKLKTIPNTTVRDDINLAQSFYYKGFLPDSNQKYLHLCYTYSYNPYRAIYSIGAFRGTVTCPNLPYTIQKARSYPDSLSGGANMKTSYASVSVAVQRSTQHMWVVRGISPENAYMTTTGLLGQNEQVPTGYTGKIGNYSYASDKVPFLPTGLYVSGYIEGKNPLTLDDIVISSTAHTATDDEGTLSVDVSNETTLGGARAQGVFVSVQDLKDPFETSPFNLAYPTWVNDEKDRFEAGSPLYIYFRNTVVKKKYISRIFVGQSSRKAAGSDDDDVLEEFDKQVDLNALVAATGAATDEVIPVNVAADNTIGAKDHQPWYMRTDSSSRINIEPEKDQPAAYISVARTDKEDEAIRGILLYKSSPDKAVPNQMSVEGATYYCASNNCPIRMSNGNSYYLYYTYNMGVSPGRPLTSIGASATPLITGYATALVTDRGDTEDSKAVPYGDSSTKTFIHAGYDRYCQVYFNKLYVASYNSELSDDASDAELYQEAKLRLLEQGCTEFLNMNLNDYAGGNKVYIGYRSFMRNDMAIRMKNTDEAKDAEEAAQLNQAIYDIVFTVGEPFKPEGFVSQRYQIYYAPVIYVDKQNNNKISGVNLNDGTIGPEIYMYYTSPYAAKEYNERVKSDRRAILSQMPNNYFSSPLTKLAVAKRDLVPYIQEPDATSSEQDTNLPWEYVMQSDNKRPVDLNDGAVWFDSSGISGDNRISMFVQRADGSVKPSAEITGGYMNDYVERGIMYNNK